MIDYLIELNGGLNNDLIRKIEEFQQLYIADFQNQCEQFMKTIISPDTEDPLLEMYKLVSQINERINEHIDSK